MKYVLDQYIPDALGEVVCNLQMHAEGDPYRWRQRSVGYHLFKGTLHYLKYLIGNRSEAHLTHAATRFLFALQLAFERYNLPGIHYFRGRIDYGRD